MNTSLDVNEAAEERWKSAAEHLGASYTATTLILCCLNATVVALAFERLLWLTHENSWRVPSTPQITYLCAVFFGALFGAIGTTNFERLRWPSKHDWISPIFDNMGDCSLVFLS